MAGFVEALYPTANGAAPPPPDTETPHLRTQNEFLAAYYQINVAHAALVEARSNRPSPGRNSAEGAALRQIESALRHRDAVEDRYAPFGVIAEATLRNGLVVDLKFTHGDVNALGQLRSAGQLFAAYVPIRGQAMGPVQPLSFETAQRLLNPDRPGPAA